MNDQEGFEFIQGYFKELFVNRNVDALEEYLDPDYFDDDIGDPTIDHISNSKEYLREWFRNQPSIGVDVVNATMQGDVISAFLEWHVSEKEIKKVIRKGVAVFVLKDRRIIKRHTFVYFEAQ